MITSADVVLANVFPVNLRLHITAQMVCTDGERAESERVAAANVKSLWFD